MNANIFAMASMFKFRYPFKGTINTEDLWDLNLEQLDDVYKALNKMKMDKDSQGCSLLSNKSLKEYDDTLDVKIEIVKYIFEEKVEAARKHEADIINAEKKRRILEVLAKKQDDSLNNMTEDELRKMLEDIG